MIEKINSPQDLKDLSIRELRELCGEIREKITDTVSRNGGHLASNLGMVETTVAIHKVFDTPRDEVERVKEIVKREMEGALDLGVPLDVSVGVGNNWLEAH